MGNPGTTRQRLGRPRSVPPAAAIPSADLASAKAGVSSGDAALRQMKAAFERQKELLREFQQEVEGANGKHSPRKSSWFESVMNLFGEKD